VSIKKETPLSLEKRMGKKPGNLEKENGGKEGRRLDAKISSYQQKRRGRGGG